MRSPPEQIRTGGADERLSARRPASEPTSGGEALVEHPGDRGARAEQELRHLRERAEAAQSARSVLGGVATALAEQEGRSLPDLLRLALPLLGDWCIIEELQGDRIERRVVASEGAREAAAASLAGPVSGREGTIALGRVQRVGRVEAVAEMPEVADAGEGIRRALDALGDGPMLLVPVQSRGCLLAALAFGRVAHGAAAYAADEERLAAELASLVALGMTQRRTAAAVEEAARTKSEFLTMMSHELRTPLNAIAGYAQLLEMGLRGPLTDEQRDAVLRIMRGQEHLLELVDSVLTFTRLTSGRLSMERADLSTRTLLALATDPVQREFAARGIALEVEQCAEGARVIADPERAPQVLRHLLSNALKFTAPGGTVTIGCSCSAGAVRFSVTDTGCGIPPAQRESIFHPFVQVEKGHTRSADGSGLGLAIGRELAIRMGGTLDVTSELGVGSRFVLTLPRAGGATQEAGRVSSSIDTTSGQG